jgi:hypothetical protein
VLRYSTRLYEIESGKPIKLKRRHILAASLIALAGVLVGLAAFALSGGLDRTVTERVHGSGPRVVRVALVDAVVGFDPRTNRLDPGQSQRLDLGVLTSHPRQLYCTLPGHNPAGMTLDIQIQHRTADTA